MINGKTIKALNDALQVGLQLELTNSTLIDVLKHMEKAGFTVIECPKNVSVLSLDIVGMRLEELASAARNNARSIADRESKKMVESQAVIYLEVAGFLRNAAMEVKVKNG